MFEFDVSVDELADCVTEVCDWNSDLLFSITVSHGDVVFFY